MTREHFLKTCIALGLTLPAFTSIAFSSTITYDQDAENWINYLNKLRGKYNLVLLSDDEKEAIRRYVKLYKQLGTWDKLDVIYLFKNAQNEEIATINWRNPPLL